MITLGIILLLISWLANIGTLGGIGIVLIIVGACLNIMGGSRGKRYY